LPHHTDDRRPGVQEELLADLEEADLAHQCAHELLRFAEPGDVERKNQSASRPPLPQPAERPAKRHDADTFFTWSATRPPTSARGTSSAFSARRILSSTLPRANALGPTVTRSGMPIRSASLNLTPGRSSRSSSRVSMPRPRSSV